MLRWLAYTLRTSLAVSTRAYVLRCRCCWVLCANCANGLRRTKTTTAAAARQSQQSHPRRTTSSRDSGESFSQFGHSVHTHTNTAYRRRQRPKDLLCRICLIAPQQQQQQRPARASGKVDSYEIGTVPSANEKCLEKIEVARHVTPANKPTGAVMFDIYVSIRGRLIFKPCTSLERCMRGGAHTTLGISLKFAQQIPRICVLHLACNSRPPCVCASACECFMRGRQTRVYHDCAYVVYRIRVAAVQTDTACACACSCAVQQTCL